MCITAHRVIISQGTDIMVVMDTPVTVIADMVMVVTIDSSI
jgi:hypothetical protein